MVYLNCDLEHDCKFVTDLLLFIEGKYVSSPKFTWKEAVHQSQVYWISWALMLLCRSCQHTVGTIGKITAQYRFSPWSVGNTLSGTLKMFGQNVLVLQTWNNEILCLMVCMCTCLKVLFVRRKAPNQVVAGVRIDGDL